MGNHSPIRLNSPLPHTTAVSILGSRSPIVARKCLCTGSGKFAGNSTVPSSRVFSAWGGKGLGLTCSPPQPTPASRVSKPTTVRAALVNFLIYYLRLQRCAPSSNRIIHPSTWKKPSRT